METYIHVSILQTLFIFFSKLDVFLKTYQMDIKKKHFMAVHAKPLCCMCIDDFNRVVLSALLDVDNSDYINASYVDVSTVSYSHKNN